MQSGFLVANIRNCLWSSRKGICYKASGEHIELWEDLRTRIRKYIEKDMKWKAKDQHRNNHWICYC